MGKAFKSSLWPRRSGQRIQTLYQSLEVMEVFLLFIVYIRENYFVYIELKKINENIQKKNKRWKINKKRNKNKEKVFIKKLK